MLSLFIGCIFGCGQPIQLVKPTRIDFELVYYVDQYYQAMIDEEAIESVPARLESILFKHNYLPNEDVLGVCYIQGNRRWIEIIKPNWDSLSEIIKTIVIMHEAQHCTQFAEHRTKFIDNNKVHLSIMNSYIETWNDRYYEKYWNILKSELFFPDRYIRTGSLIDHNECETIADLTKCYLRKK